MKKFNKMMIYIVYAYRSNFYMPVKYIKGLYYSKEDAVKRQHVICGENVLKGVNGSLNGNGYVTFINVLPYGDCDIEMFTTSS